MGDPLDEVLRASNQTEAAIREQARAARQSSLDRMFELLMMALILMGIAFGALLFTEFFTDNDPVGGGVPTEQHHHDDGTETPTFNPFG